MSRRVSVVIGAGRGIGAAAAARLAERGDAVVLVDRAQDDARLRYPLASRDDLEAAANVARQAGGDPDAVVTRVADATDGAGVQAVLDETERIFGGVDVVVVTAGVIAGGVPLWEMPDDELQAVMQVDLDAVITIARAAIPAMLRRPVPRSGRFVAVASTAASRGLPLLAAYCAAKAGVVGLVRALGVELRGTGITANAVSPGSTDTAILAESARQYGLPTSASFANQQPIERLIHPDEVADVITFLTGPAAGAITGADYTVDGGLAI